MQAERESKDRGCAYCGKTGMSFLEASEHYQGCGKDKAMAIELNQVRDIMKEATKEMETLLTLTVGRLTEAIEVLKGIKENGTRRPRDAADVAEKVVKFDPKNYSGPTQKGKKFSDPTIPISWLEAWAASCRWRNEKNPEGEYAASNKKEAEWCDAQVAKRKEDERKKLGNGPVWCGDCGGRMSEAQREGCTNKQHIPF